MNDNIGLLITLVVGSITLVTILAEGIKYLAIYLIKKRNNKHTYDVPSTTLFNPTDTYQKVKEIHMMCSRNFEIITRVGEDGTPLIYSRQGLNILLDAQKEITHTQQQIIEKMLEFSYGQKRLVELLDRIESRMNTSTQRKT